MTDTPKPVHRIVVCRGEYCNMSRRADTLLKRLREAVDDANSGSDIPRASLRTANCLSMCAVGPNMVIYPEDAVFNHLDAAKLETIIAAYLPCADE